MWLGARRSSLGSALAIAVSHHYAVGRPPVPASGVGTPEIPRADPEARPYECLGILQQPRGLVPARPPRSPGERFEPEARSASGTSRGKESGLTRILLLA